MSRSETSAPRRRASTRHSPRQVTLKTAPATRTAQKKRTGYDRNPPDRTTPTWLTPPDLLRALGPFDLDPCTPADMPWRTAKRMLTEVDDGLATPWPKRSFVFHNPPYGAHQGAWMKKAAEHGHGVSLVFCRMDTAWAHEHVLKHRNTAAVVFLRGRVRFHRPDGTQAGTSGAPSMLIAHGDEAAERLKRAVESGAIRGAFVPLRHRR